MKTKIFIHKAKEIHGNKYDYCSSKFITADTKTDITCRIHGIFSQTPKMHCKGQGCSKCALLKSKYNLRSKAYVNFKKNMWSLYKGKYSLVGVFFKRSTDKIVLNCPIHGKFTTTPSVLINSNRSCLKCAGTYHNGTETFLEKAKKIHDNTYLYNNVVYINNSNKVRITCRTHGEFIQRPSDHLAGKGCGKCGNNIQTQDEIIRRFNEVHNFYYKYDNVQFINMNSKVTITCPKHGNFSMKPSDHIFNLQGCSGCASTGFNSTKPAYFYILKVKSNSSTYFKIGITNKTLKQRYSSTYDKNKINKCFLYKFQIGGLARQLESELLRTFSLDKVNNKILLSGNTEILRNDIRKTSKFKEIFNEYRKKDTYTRK